MTTFKEEIENTTEVLSAIKKEYTEQTKKAFTSLTAKFFETYPEVKTIYWGQYIPGFNDGDPCEFTLTDINFTSAEYEEVDGPYFGDETENDEYFNFERSKGGSEQLTKDMDSFREFLYSIEDHLESAFDSNAFVRLHRGGTEVEEYDCGY